MIVFGVGSVYRPLPVGEHTLEITVDSAFLSSARITSA
jgi:hypothetical protein